MQIKALRSRGAVVVIAIQVITVLVVAYIEKLGYLQVSEAVIIALLSLILENVVLLVVERETVGPTLEELSRRHILLRHEELALSDPVLRGEYLRIVEDLSRRLSNLGGGHFSTTIDDITPLSMEVVRSLKEEAFATVVVGETDQIFDMPSGKEFLRECYAAAKRIRKFTRLFIVRDYVDLTPRIYDLLEEHAKGNITVLVATRHMVSAKGLNPTEDFGLWDKRYLMHLEAEPGRTSVKLAVQVGGQPVDLALKRSLQLTELAKPWSEFRDELCKPLNGAWQSLLPQRDFLEPPAGPSQADVQTMWDLAVAESVPNHVLVLGYTKAIVEFFVSKSCTVEVLDIGDYQPHGRHERTSFHQGNWLTWEPPRGLRYDVIAGDDVLNNLGVWQYHIFFRRMASLLLKPHGKLVMRATGKYSEIPCVLPSFDSVLQELKKLMVDGKVNESMITAKCWPMFHGPEFYDERAQSFDLRSWNERLHRAEKTPGELASLRIEQPLFQTSLLFSEIMQYASPWFTFLGQRPADRSYTCLADGFENYYRILGFKVKSS